MTDPIEKRDPTPIVAATISEAEYSVHLTHKTDMTELAYKAVVEPVKLTQNGQNVRSLLGALIIGGALAVAALCFGQNMPPGIVQAAIWAGALVGVTNGEAVTKLIDKLIKQR